MRFVKNGPDVPHDLIVDQEKGEVIFVCGAGVSRTVGLPLFKELVEFVYTHLGETWAHHPAEAEAMDARQFDRVLRCLERRLAASDLPGHRNMRERIRNAVGVALTPPEGADLANHAALLALSRDTEGRERLLTTNFDTLFERAWLADRGTRTASHAGVALPQPKTARATGVLHLHGRQADTQLDLVQTDIVLTSAEFGDAYLRTGWASRYVYDLARTEILVLVGYQADDPPMRYLLEALEADRERFSDLKKVYAFGECTPGDEARVRAQWEAKGVEPILYLVDGNDHGTLYSTLREWRRYADDPTAWRRAKLLDQFAACANPPTDMQVQAALAWLDRGDAAQLMGDLSPSPVWLPILMQRGIFKTDSLPAEWIAKRVDDPDMIQACASFDKIDSVTTWSIERELERTHDSLSQTRERAWRLLLSVKRAKNKADIYEDRWYDGARAIQRGRFDFQSRDLVVGVLRPRLFVDKPFRWPLSDDAADREETLHGLLRLDFESLSHPPPAEILAAWPDTVEANAALLRTLDRALHDALERAADIGLLEGWDIASHDVPSVAEHPQNHRRGFYPIVRALADIWTRAGRTDPDQARQLAAAWQVSPFLLVQRLGLFAKCSDLFDAHDVAKTLLALDDHTFWVSGAQVEIMRLVTTRWAQFSDVDRQGLEARLVAGVPMVLFEGSAIADADELQSISDASIHRRLSRITTTSGVISPESVNVLAGIQARHPKWVPGTGDRDDFPSWHEMRHGPSGHPELLAGVPVDQLVQEAFRIQVERQFEEGDLWRVFCSTDPDRALQGLINEGNANRWPFDAWRHLLWAAAEREEVELHRGLAGQILRMPEPTLTSLVESAASWLERRRLRLSEPDAAGNSFFFPVWDQLATIVYAARVPAERHEDTGDKLMSEALNSSGGNLASALLSAMDDEKPAEGPTLPPTFAPRFDRIANAENRAGLLGRVQLVRDLAYLDAIASTWTADNLVPRLDWTHLEARAMWEAYAYGRLGSGRLFMSVKPHLLAAFDGKNLSSDVLEALFGKLLHIAFFHRREQGVEYELTSAEIKWVLALAPSSVRRHVGWTLWNAMSDDTEDGDRPNRWRALVGPIFSKIWPLDARLRDPESSQNLTLMALECGGAFPEAVDAILDVLVPYRLYQLAHALRLETRHDELVGQHPLAFVRLVNALVDPTIHPVPPDLPEFLQTCIEADPLVARDPAYVRLFGLRRQLGA